MEPNPFIERTSQRPLRALCAAAHVESLANMRVASALVEDSLEIAQIHVASWQAAYAGLFPAEYLSSLSVSERAERWREVLASRESRTFVAQAAGGLLGFVSFGKCRDPGAPATRGELWALYVTPNAWSTGVGHALWEVCRVQLLHAGCAEVSLWVLSGNARGIRFYEALGFSLEPGMEQSFERGGATLEEVRLVFRHMSANPSTERTAESPLRALYAAAHVER